MTRRALAFELAGAATLGLIISAIAVPWSGSPFIGVLWGIAFACVPASMTWQDWKENLHDHFVA